MQRLFVSYAREDRRDIDELVEHLRLMGYETWVDSELRGGQDWWNEILRRIAASDVFVAVLSQGSLNSTACRREFEWAEATRRPMLPVAIETLPAALPTAFARRQIIDYSNPAERHRAALMLQAGLGMTPAAPPLPDPLPDPPGAPLSYLTGLVDLISQTGSIDHPSQHQIVQQLAVALHSIDPDERQGGRDILERFASRSDVYADVDRIITALRQAAEDTAPPDHPAKVHVSSSDVHSHADVDGGVLACASCRAALREGAKYCHNCGAATVVAATPAEYKQATILFADVVHSMDIAAEVGPERLRELMTELVHHTTLIVERYGGRVAKSSGDGIVALFGAPKALEDHGLRACRAALDIQSDVARMGSEIRVRDGVDLTLRIGLSSGQVVAGDVGKEMGYDAVGVQVGMARRIGSAALPGGVALSSSTANLVADNVVLDGPQELLLDGSARAIAVHILKGIVTAERHGPRRDTILVGREWELGALSGILDQALDGQGRVVRVTGPPGIGKSRLAAELANLARERGATVYWTHCQSHTADVPFQVVAEMLREVAEIGGLDDAAARARIRALAPNADGENVLLLCDLLGIADPADVLPKIDADARRRRLTALVSSLLLARKSSAVFILEDLHWIDEISESMIANFASVISQTSSMALMTYRTDYEGALSELSGGQTIALAPLNVSDSRALTEELLGADDSVAEVSAAITARAAGNPLFIEEIVRELAEQGVLSGTRGSYRCETPVADIDVPATLQATIAARLDRLGPAAKQTLNAAAVVGFRFDPKLLASLDIDLAIEELVDAELIEPVLLAGEAEYVFRHPLVRTVAYESQLKPGRSELHRKLAAAIQEASGPSDENAALIAEHLEAAGDLMPAYEWHMRAGNWLTSRDISAAHASWRRAADVADRLPVDGPGRMALRIAPRAVLCALSWRAEATLEQPGLDDLRILCTQADDDKSLLMGVGGTLMAMVFRDRVRDAIEMTTECCRLIDATEDVALKALALVAPASAYFQAGRMTECRQLAQRVIDLADGDAGFGGTLVGSPLAIGYGLRAASRFALGDAGFLDDFERGSAIGRDVDTTSLMAVRIWRNYAILNSALPVGETELHETDEVLVLAEQSGDDFALSMARYHRAVSLVFADRQRATSVIDELDALRRANIRQGYLVQLWDWRFDLLVGMEMLRLGEVDHCVNIVRLAIETMLDTGLRVQFGPATALLVESLLTRGSAEDLLDAERAIDRLAAEPAEPGFVLYELPLLRLRALLAEARGDHASYLDYRDRYREMARRVDFKPHIAMAESMP